MNAESWVSQLRIQDIESCLENAYMRLALAVSDNN